ncbi:helix-turn-helix transcriptional regulator [Bifidobacterium sp. 82T24]|uniref:helix-turn-helix domain-containing protein n=1 Tax=Bifidobacterium pluvialisilvae TaxID=2834436 RepID=UPI001C57CE78|nr:helix-turn-helix transcriptional regulator [Bifidobacterium pluvialisilvae]MBW3088795.1 helix-turn-helix transcriptional regulator [Bifidobacterium pluvialisilvae]
MDIIEYAKAVARNVSTAMDDAGLSVLATSEKTGIARTTLNRRLENPGISPFTVLELAQISDATGVSLETLTASKHPSALADKEVLP